MSKIIENYCLEEHLGTDFYGYDSYRAKHIQNSQYYLVKSLNRSLYNGTGFYKQGLDTEISILNKVAHSNIIRYEKMLKTAHNIYVVYQFCSGGSLYDRVLTKGLSDTQQVNYMRQLTLAMKEFHRNDIVVVSLHPKNIYIGKDSNLRLTNFAHCLNVKQNEKAESDPKNMEYHDYLGPDTYASHASDIYSLGLVFSFIKYGKITNLQSLLNSKLKAKDPTAQLIQAMTAKSADDRIDIDAVKIKLNLPTNMLQNKSCQLDSVKTPKGRKTSEDLNNFAKLKVQPPGSTSMSRQGSVDQSKSVKRQLLSPARIVLPRSDRSMTDTKSQVDVQADNSKQLKTIIKDRNKYTYLIMMANDVIVQDLTPSSIKLAFLICKKACINARILQKSLQSTILCEPDGKATTAIIKNQISQIYAFFQQLKQSIVQQNKLLQDSAFELQYENDDALSQAYLRKILKDYVNIVFTPIDPNNRANEEQSLKLLHHINNICGIQVLDKFFNEYINDSVVNLLDQVYFTELDKMELKEIHRFVLEKMTVDRIV